MPQYETNIVRKRGFWEIYPHSLGLHHISITATWDERHSVNNYRRIDCLFNNLFRIISQKGQGSTLLVDSPDGSPTQMSSNVESVMETEKVSNTKLHCCTVFALNIMVEQVMDWPQKLASLSLIWYSCDAFHWVIPFLATSYIMIKTLWNKWDNEFECVKLVIHPIFEW